MAGVDKSVKLIMNEFQRSIAEVPLEVYYQNIKADQYTANGFQFNIKSPGQLALLDMDIWIRYRIQIVETADNSLVNSFETPAPGLGDNVAGQYGPLLVPFPSSNNKFAFRSGNCIQRAIQNFSIMLNNRTITVQPFRWIDVLNRMYVSNDQAEHEFSASGGRFDEGNHGVRTDHVQYKNRIQAIWATNNAEADSQRFTGNNFPSAGTYAAPLAAAAPAANTGKILVTLTDGYAPIAYQTDADQAKRDIPFQHLLPLYPVKYPFYNPGFSNRVDKMIDKLRSVRQEFHNGTDYDQVHRSIDTAALANVAATTVQPLQFQANLDIAGNPSGGTHRFSFDIYERLPIPLFKMYSNDEIFGVLPNIVSMQIQANFISTMKENILRSNNNALGCNLDWTGLDGSHCELFLRWYTPPQTMSIPREITIPYKQINVWAKSISNLTAGAANSAWRDYTISEYGITLQAIPDLLLIYLKYDPAFYTLDTPDDFNAELLYLSINIDNASGKLNQISSLDLYNKWKKLLKHSDNKIIGYDEWRKYCCVACLQPEDYGCRYGPGYSNSTNLGIKGTARFWATNPAIAFAAAEQMGGAGGAGTNVELEVVSIYNRNSLTLRADGTAHEELLRMAADFNLGRPSMGAVPPPDIRGSLMA